MPALLGLLSLHVTSQFGVNKGLASRANPPSHVAFLFRVTVVAELEVGVTFMEEERMWGMDANASLILDPKQ